MLGARDSGGTEGREGGANEGPKRAEGHTGGVEDKGGGEGGGCASGIAQGVARARAFHPFSLEIIKAFAVLDLRTACFQRGIIDK